MLNMSNISPRVGIFACGLICLGCCELSLGADHLTFERVMGDLVCVRLFFPQISGGRMFS